MAKTETTLCVGCQAVPVEIGDDACPDCRQKYPPALLKACWDEFEYACGLRNGAVIRFSGARVHGEWVSLWNSGACAPMPDDPAFSREGDFWWKGEPHVLGLPFPCPRGVDVRLADIVWVADAPCGS